MSKCEKMRRYVMHIQMGHHMIELSTLSFPFSYIYDLVPESASVYKSSYSQTKVALFQA